MASGLGWLEHTGTGPTQEAAPAPATAASTMCMEMNTPRTSIARCIVTGEKINYNWSLETKTVKAFLNGYINIPIL